MANITEAQRLGGLAGIWVCMTLSSIFITLRFYCKHLRARKLFWDDWILFASWLCLLVVCTVSTVNLNISVQPLPLPGIPITDTITLIARINLVSVAFSIMASSWSKVSFAVTLLRVSDWRWIKTFLWTAIILFFVTYSLVWPRCSGG